MKRLLLLVTVALAGSFYSARAQEAKFDEAGIIKKIEKLEADTQNPKKSGKAATWIDLGKAYYDAATVAATGLFRGLDEITAKALFPKPQEGTETVGNVEYVKWSYPYFDVYLKDGAVYFWTMKKQVVENALDKAVKAYEKAYEIDNAAKVGEGFTQIANAYKQNADNFSGARQFLPMADAFATAYAVEQHPAVNKFDTLACYYAGYLYTLEKKFDLAEKFLKEAIDHGIYCIDEGSEGETYYYLFHSLYGQKKMDEAKQALIDGITKFPKNSEILEAMIGFYNETKEDPKTIIPYIQKGIENDPNNADLWSGLGSVYERLGDNQKATEAFTKAVSLVPDDFGANYNFGLMIARMADEKTTEFNNKEFASREERDAALDEIVKVYAQAVGPLEKALAASPSDEATLQLLKNICFRLRDTSPEMMEKYNKYNEMYKNLGE